MKERLEPRTGKVYVEEWMREHCFLVDVSEGMGSAVQSFLKFKEQFRASPDQCLVFKGTMQCGCFIFSFNFLNCKSLSISLSALKSKVHHLQCGLHRLSCQQLAFTGGFEHTDHPAQHVVQHDWCGHVPAIPDADQRFSLGQAPPSS